MTAIAAGCSSGFQRFDNNFYQSAVPQAPNAEQQTAYNPYPGSSGSLDNITTASVNRHGVRRLAPLSSVAPQPVQPQYTHAPEPTYVAPQASYQPPQNYRPPYRAAPQAQAPRYSTYQPQPAYQPPASQRPTGVNWQSNAVTSSPVPVANTPRPPQRNAASAPAYNPPTPTVQAVSQYVNGQKTDRITTASVSKATTVVQKQTARIQPQVPAPAVPQFNAAAAPSIAPHSGGWTSAGGTTIVARPGETLYNLSKRYGVPVEEIQKANNINASNGLQAGQKILIPNYVFSRSAPVSAPDANPQTKASRASTGYRGEVVAAPSVVPTRRPPYSEPRVFAQTKAPQNTDPVTTASVKKDNKPNVAKVATPAKIPESSGLSQFRWPVQGRIVSGFGQSGGLGSNEGIDISVPEGTPIKAAENGVVIYAGNEISNYGNLILVRHRDDWVSAYAHAKDFNVKKGDNVSRGQVIGRTGRTGAADRPKLHFELRKDSAPVDPRKYLAG